MKVITYVCDRLGCEEEDTIAPKSPAPEGWGEVQIQPDKRTVVLCPHHLAELRAALVAPEPGIDTPRALPTAEQAKEGRR